MSSWAPWSTEAFSRARQAQKPLLVVVGPVAQASLKSAEREIQERFIPVSVDPQIRPDVAIRIGENRAVVLSSEGVRQAVLPLPADNLGATLTHLADESAAQSAGRLDGATTAWTGAVREKPAAVAPTDEQVAAAFADLAAAPASDDISAIAALLYTASERPESLPGEAVVRRLSEWIGTFYDSNSGKFRVGGLPISLDAHARRALLAWDAHALIGEYRWREIAEATIKIIRSELYDPKIGACRQQIGVDVYPAEGNALAALVALRATAYDVPGAEELARGCLTFLQSTLYDPLLGITHARGGDGGEVHGLLGDAAWTALAFCEAYLLTGEKSHREFADSLLRFLFQELWERERGGFLDRIPRRDEPAILREIHIDLEKNVVALEVCWRLHHMKGVMNYRRWLDWGLGAVWPLTAGDPVTRAGLARIADMSRRGRADFELVGRVGDSQALALLKALRRKHVPRAIVSFVDPDDQDYILAHKLEAENYPRLFGCAGDLRRLADAKEPDGVEDVVDAVSHAGRA